VIIIDAAFAIVADVPNRRRLRFRAIASGTSGWKLEKAAGFGARRMEHAQRWQR
jgi:hypothetical protein